MGWLAVGHRRDGRADAGSTKHQGEICGLAARVRSISTVSYSISPLRHVKVGLLLCVHGQFSAAPLPSVPRIYAATGACIMRWCVSLVEEEAFHFHLTGFTAQVLVTSVAPNHIRRCMRVSMMFHSFTSLSQSVRMNQSFDQDKDRVESGSSL